MRPLPFAPTQEQYDAWFQEGVERVRTDPDFYEADLNDGTLMLLTAHEVAKAYPDKIGRLREVTSECVEAAMGQLGMFAGAANLASQVDLPAQEVQDMMMATFTQTNT